MSEKQISLDPRVVRNIRRQAARMKKMDTMGESPRFKVALASGKETFWTEQKAENDPPLIAQPRGQPSRRQRIVA